MKPTYFTAPEAFNRWLKQHHAKETELLVGFHKVASGKPCMTWSESVDEALCYGWIDGVRKSIDESRYTIRFTPRKSGSIWSAINIKKIDALTAQGRLQPAGLAAFQKRQQNKSGIYSYENAPAVLSAEFAKRLKASAKATAFLRSMPPGYHRVVVHWVMRAKQAATRLRRFEALLHDSEAGLKVKPYR